MARGSRCRMILAALLVAGGLLASLAGSQGLVLCLAPGDHLAVEMGSLGGCCSAPPGPSPSAPSVGGTRDGGCGACIDIILPAQKARAAGDRRAGRSPGAGGGAPVLHPAAANPPLPPPLRAEALAPAAWFQPTPLVSLQTVILLI